MLFLQALGLLVLQKLYGLVLRFVDGKPSILRKICSIQNKRFPSHAKASAGREPRTHVRTYVLTYDLVLGKQSYTPHA